MKPQKRSIRDFFSPVSRPSLEAEKGSGLQEATSNESTVRAPQPTSLDTSRTPQSKTPVTTSTQSPPTTSQPSIATSAPTIRRATSDEAQPPIPSQTSENSGASKRIVSNGEQVVLNSDSDTDSLPDLDWGEPRTSFKKTAIVTRSKHASDDEEDGLRKPAKRVKSEKRFFNLLMETAQKSIETELKIIESKANLDKSLAEPLTTSITINEDVLGQAVQNNDEDPDKAHRLFLAMQRTNATQPDSAFYFFEDTSDSIPVQQKFPISSLPMHRWASTFKDSSSRDQAFLTGFAHQIFCLQELPDELASWMLDQICSGRNEVLNAKYLEILESHHEHLQMLLDRNRLDAIFRGVGADVKSLNSNRELALSSEAPSGDLSLPSPSLKSIARLLGRAAPWLRTKPRSHALYTLCHACLDERVTADVDVLRTIQDAIEALICNFADNSRLISGVESPLPQQDIQSLITSQLGETIPQLLSRITHPILQRNLVCVLPARSPLTAYLQRYLALSFIVYPTAVDVPLANPRIPELVHNHLNQSPHFLIDKNTDYGHLAARLTLLDIAMGPGLSSVPYKPLLSPANSQAGSSPATAAFSASSNMKAFNEEVDALAQQVKILGNSIVEAGAAIDLTILDAKDSIERLYSRLDHAVRIGGKKAHNVFGNDDGSKQLRVSKFFSKAKKTSTSAIKRGGIFDEEDDAHIEVDNGLMT